ncbi:MAG: MerR family transcriptional regulator [Actinomycetota bacterium]|nr:MerR family transcriptional regulator [Actinomycetota bacterium]
MNVKDLADLAGTTVRTVRYYHQLGLLSVPERGTTWRSYGFTHLTRLMRIRWLVESGVPLGEVPHLLRAPVGADERTLVVEDLDAVLASIEDKISGLSAQRRQVQVLVDRVRTHGRLSPLPEPIVAFYDALLQHPLPPAMVEAIRRERELLELACYRAAVPDDVVALVQAMGEGDIDELLGLWQDCHRIDEAAGGARLTPELRGRADEVVAHVVALADRVAPEATGRLLARAAELDRPAIRAAVDLAYSSATYRHVVSAVVALARGRCVA